MTTKADDNGPFKEFTFEDWFREGMQGFCGQIKFKKGRVNTSEFESHMRNAAREQLLAVRSLVDSFIEIFDEGEGAETEASGN